MIAGEGLKFTVLNGACDGESAELIARATAEETSDAGDSYCVLPAPESDEDYRTSTCTALSSGMKIDGVGLFYDDRCNSADYSGCFARSIPACRLCFWDKDLWTTRFPSSRVPDWELCPCCVANTLGIDCASGGGGGTDEGVIIGISVGIAGVIAIACCLSCAFGPTIVRFVSAITAAAVAPNPRGCCSGSCCEAFRMIDWLIGLLLLPAVGNGRGGGMGGGVPGLAKGRHGPLHGRVLQHHDVANTHNSTLVDPLLYSLAVFHPVFDRHVCGGSGCVFFCRPGFSHSRVDKLRFCEDFPAQRVCCSLESPPKE